MKTQTAMVGPVTLRAVLYAVGALGTALCANAVRASLEVPSVYLGLALIWLPLLVAVWGVLADVLPAARRTLPGLSRLGLESVVAVNALLLLLAARTQLSLWQVTFAVLFAALMTAVSAFARFIPKLAPQGAPELGDSATAPAADHTQALPLHAREAQEKPRKDFRLPQFGRAQDQEEASESQADEPQARELSRAASSSEPHGSSAAPAQETERTASEIRHDFDQRAAAQPLSGRDGSSEHGASGRYVPDHSADSTRVFDAQAIDALAEEERRKAERAAADEAAARAIAEKESAAKEPAQQDAAAQKASEEEAAAQAAQQEAQQEAAHLQEHRREEAEQRAEAHQRQERLSGRQPVKTQKVQQKPTDRVQQARQESQVPQAAQAPQGTDQPAPETGMIQASVAGGSLVAPVETGASEEPRTEYQLRKRGGEPRQEQSPDAAQHRDLSSFNEPSFTQQHQQVSLGNQSRQPSSNTASASRQQASRAFWFAVPDRRPLMDRGGARRISTVPEQVWVLGLDEITSPHGRSFYVQLEDGTRGYLHDLRGVEKG